MLCSYSNACLLSSYCDVAAHTGVATALIAEAACNWRSEQQVITLLLNTDSDLSGFAAVGIDAERMSGQ